MRSFVLFVLCAIAIAASPTAARSIQVFDYELGYYPAGSQPGYPSSQSQFSNDESSLKDAIDFNIRLMHETRELIAELVHLKEIRGPQNINPVQFPRRPVPGYGRPHISPIPAPLPELIPQFPEIILVPTTERPIEEPPVIVVVDQPEKPRVKPEVQPEVEIQPVPEPEPEVEIQPEQPIEEPVIEGRKEPVVEPEILPIEPVLEGQVEPIEEPIIVPEVQPIEVPIAEPEAPAVEPEVPIVQPEAQASKLLQLLDKIPLNGSPRDILQWAKDKMPTFSGIIKKVDDPRPPQVISRTL